MHGTSNRLKKLASSGAKHPRIWPWIRGLRYLLPHGGSHVEIDIRATGVVQPNRDELPIVRRIFDSYRRMKEDQRIAPSIYRPSSLWQEALDRSYSHLNNGRREHDIDKFHFFLANFGAWDQYTGVTWSTLVRDQTKSLIKSLYLKHEVFGGSLRLWQHYHADRLPLKELEHPLVGNQYGAFIDGVFVTPFSFVYQICASMLGEIISMATPPVIAELGGGYGPLAYYILRPLAQSTYVSFDLPETLCLAAYFLMQCFPGKRTLLYGEEAYSPAQHGRYDMIFMPNYSMSELGADSVHLFLNTSSLGEMTRDAATHYIHIIAEASQYFFHWNHERIRNSFEDGGTSLLAHEYPMPRDKYTLVFRYPEMMHMLFRGCIDLEADTFIYLYRRLADSER